MPTPLTNPAEAILRAFALAYPGTREDHPWGETAFKVADKIFVCWSSGEQGLSLSTKLPQSNAEALAMPFTSPTHYGMGKHGWVSSSFGPAGEVPIDLMCRWIDESYRAVAPKKLLKDLVAPAMPQRVVSSKPVPKAARKVTRKAPRKASPSSSAPVARPRARKR